MNNITSGKVQTPNLAILLQHRNILWCLDENEASSLQQSAVFLYICMWRIPLPLSFSLTIPAKGNVIGWLKPCQVV